MRYYKIDSQTQKIKEVYTSLRELKLSLDSSIELMDIIDDTDQTLDSNEWIFTEDMLNNYIKKEFTESEEHNVKNQLELNLEIKDLEEQLQESQLEIDNVHNEVVNLEASLSESRNLTSTTEKAKKEVESKLEETKSNLTIYKGILEDCKNHRASLLIPQVNAILTDLIVEIKQSSTDIAEFKEELLNA